jgi:hypothetical protein
MLKTPTNHKAGKNFIQSQSEKLPAPAVQLRLTADGIQPLSDTLLLSFTGIVCMLYVDSPDIPVSSLFSPRYRTVIARKDIIDSVKGKEYKTYKSFP